MPEKPGKTAARIPAVDSACALPIGSKQGEIRVTGDVYSIGIKWDATKTEPSLNSRNSH